MTGVDPLWAWFIAAGLDALRAAVLAAVGYVFGLIGERVVLFLWDKAYFQDFVRKYKLEKAFLGIPLGVLLGKIVKWWVFLFFLVEAVNSFRLVYATQLAEMLLTIYTSLVAGILYLVIGAMIAKYVGDRLKETKVPGGQITVVLSQAIIMYFALVTALPYFGVRNTYIITKAIEYILMALAGAIALGLGLAIGLGAQDEVKELIKKNRAVIEGLLVGKKK